MKTFLAATLLAATGFAAAQSPNATPQQVEGLMALARVHGVVRYFHPSDSLDDVPWDAFLVHAAERMATVPGASELGPRLEALYAPIVDGFRVVAPGTPVQVVKGDGPRVEWRHLGYGMEQDPNSPYVSWRTHHEPLFGAKTKGSYFQHRAAAEASVHADPVLRVPASQGLEAHVPVSLPLSAAKVGAEQKKRLAELRTSLAAVTVAGESVSRAQAYADGIALWNVARHFYPYWQVVQLDWEGQLRRWLAEQPATQTRVQLRDSLRRLTAPLEDGHADVADPRAAARRAFVAISVRPVGSQWAVDATGIPGQVQVGDVIAAVNGVPAERWFAERMALISGSPQYKRWRVRNDLAAGTRDTRITLQLKRGTQAAEATLTYDQAQPMQGPRPPAMKELRPGVHYVDVTRYDKAGFEKAVAQMKDARGVIFDLRGYPTAEAHTLVPHWLTGEDKAQWMFVPRFDKPYAQSSTAWSIGWQARRNAALEKPAKVLLTDGRAISYSESLAAYFPAQKVGTVMGEATAGANGNVARASMPSGMSFFFTSMRVTRHDGVTPLHRTGVLPDIAVEPTLEGIRAGRDELLERAVSRVEAASPR